MLFPLCLDEFNFGRVLQCLIVVGGVSRGRDDVDNVSSHIVAPLNCGRVRGGGPWYVVDDVE